MVLEHLTILSSVIFLENSFTHVSEVWNCLKLRVTIERGIIVNVESFFYANVEDSPWPRIQVFKNFEANIRLDQYTEMGYFQDKDDEYMPDEIVTTSYYLKNI